MSSVLKPSGPLPPQVYWRRRLLLVAVIVVVVALVGWLVARGSSSSAQEADEAPEPSTNASPGQSSPAEETQPPSGKQGDRGDNRREQHTGKPGKETKRDKPAPGRSTRDKPAPDKPAPERQEREPLAEPTGACDPTRVDMEVDVSDSAVGEPNNAAFVLTSLDTPACTLGITPDILEVRVTSGEDVVWSSADCPNVLPARELVVRADPPSTYRFTWDGQRSDDGCRTAEDLPEAGGYWLEAAFIGGEPHKGFFDLTDEPTASTRG